MVDNNGIAVVFQQIEQNLKRIRLPKRDDILISDPSSGGRLTTLKPLQNDEEEKHSINEVTSLHRFVEGCHKRCHVTRPI